MWFRTSLVTGFTHCGGSRRSLVPASDGGSASNRSRYSAAARIAFTTMRHVPRSGETGTSVAAGSVFGPSPSVKLQVLQSGADRLAAPIGADLEKRRTSRARVGERVHDRPKCAKQGMT